MIQSTEYPFSYVTVNTLRKRAAEAAHERMRRQCQQAMLSAAAREDDLRARVIALLGFGVAETLDFPVHWADMDGVPVPVLLADGMAFSTHAALTSLALLYGTLDGDTFRAIRPVLELADVWDIYDATSPLLTDDELDALAEEIEAEFSLGEGLS